MRTMMTVSVFTLSLAAIVLVNPAPALADLRTTTGILFPSLSRTAVDSLFTRREFRLIGQQKAINSDGLDNYLASENLDSARSLPGLALEYTSGALALRQGVRLAAHQGRVGATDLTNSFARITYWNFQYLIGVFLVDSPFIRWDVNAAVGLGWASVEADKGTRLSRYHAGPTDFAFPARLYTSVSLGYEPVYLVLEGGYEWGRIAHFGYKTDPGPTEPDNLLLNGAFVGVGLALSFGDSRPSDVTRSNPPTSSQETPKKTKAKKPSSPPTISDDDLGE